MKRILFIFGLLGSSYLTQAQIYRQFEDLDSLQRIEQRKVMVFIHTDWCNYCKTMENKVFKEESIQQRLDNEYYFIELNAEQEEPIKFRGYTFKFKPSGPTTGIHELAETLGTINGVLNYPTLVVLNSRYDILFQYDAFLNKKAVRKLMDEMKKIED